MKMKTIRKINHIIGKRGLVLMPTWVFCVVNSYQNGLGYILGYMAGKSRYY